MKIKKVVTPPAEQSPEIKSDFDKTQFTVSSPSKNINKKYLIGAGTFLILILMALYFFVFKNDNQKNTKIESSVNSNGYDELKRKELDLKERELKLREKELTQSQSGSVENYELENEKEDIRNTVNNLLNAWQNKDTKGFFSLLTNDYVYESIDGIRRDYDQRMNKAYEIFSNNSFISITTWDMTVNTDGQLAEVRYRQDYRSTLLSDVTTKKLYLRKINNNWKVYKELSGYN